MSQYLHRLRLMGIRKFESGNALERNSPAVFNRLDDFPPPLKLFLRTVRKADVTRFTKSIAANSSMMCCMAGEERSLNNAGMTTPIRTRRAARTILFSMRSRSSSTKRVKVGTTFC